MDADPAENIDSLRLTLDSTRAALARAAGELVMSDEDRLLDIFLRARPGHDPPKGEFFSYFTVCILHENIREFSAIVDRLRSAKSAAAGKGE